MKVLITGGAGFIGSSLGLDLLNIGIDVYFLDKENKPDFISSNKYFKININNKEALKKLFQENEFDGVIHLAAVSRVVWGEKNPKECRTTNINGTQNILSTIVENSPDTWFIFGSSREVYGEPDELPVSESYKKKPINIYGHTKLEGEKLTEKFSKEYGINSVILRFSNVYGNERDILDRVTPKFILSALKGEPLTVQGGTQVFDFTHIDYTVEGIKKAIELLNSRYKLTGYIDDFHILTGRPTPIIDLAEMIINYTNSKSKIIFLEGRDYDVNKFYGNTRKIKAILGLGEPIYIEEGLKRTIKLYKEILK